eukprot:TRINITY_DN1617_c0_g1_i4.p1 TRINITY_DN1617_c0_g1~~TRINITY_DN1617_c0_g1_i4.p1  ORF type:complete len:142 (+),score=30.17 TRINITY_DN1617_c0_g1_i4:221-646(+)
MSGPPPLEDMSESVVAMRTARHQRQQEHDRHVAYVKMMKAAHEKPEPQGTAEGAKLLSRAAETKQRAVEAEEIRAKGTCGMKKGFFDAPRKPKKAATAEDDEMEVGGRWLGILWRVLTAGDSPEGEAQTQGQDRWVRDAEH